MQCGTVHHLLHEALRTGCRQRKGNVAHVGRWVPFAWFVQFVITGGAGHRKGQGKGAGHNREDREGGGRHPSDFCPRIDRQVCQ